MRAERLIRIILLLQRHISLTAKELSVELGVSERTVSRDMEALSMAGIPLYAERGYGGGWRLSEGYRTSLTGLHLTEVQTLLALPSLALLDDLGLQEPLEAGLLKLLASLPASMKNEAQLVRERLHIDGAGWHPTEEAFPMLPIIQEAVWENRRLLITYAKQDGDSQRDVKPLGLVAKSNVWYVVADTDDGLRSFRISRIKKAERGARFERPAEFDLAVYWTTSTSSFRSALPSYLVTARIRPSLRDRIRLARYVSLLSENPCDEEDLCEVKLDCQTMKSALEFAIINSRDMEVMQPVELREAVVTHAEALLKRYRF